EQTLHAEVIYGDQSMPLTLQARFGQPGAYAGWFFPMAAGDYSFRIYGAIDGAAVDETFTSSPETFGAVEDPTPLQFPKPEGAETPGAVVGFMTGGTGWSGGVAALGLALSGGALALYRRGVADVSR
ncbi:MAG: hypothetical protein IT337_02140, partial [Thermomicrobiales bacterium]|nr:hypothetical protein [Thermomicrobiales bacterium]